MHGIMLVIGLDRLTGPAGRKMARNLWVDLSIDEPVGKWGAEQQVVDHAGLRSRADSR
jgi:hypothetical protein